MPAVVPFKFTLRDWEVDSRSLVYGNSSYSLMVVGEIMRRRKRMPKGHKFLAARYWADGGWKSFATLGEARKWLENGFREQILGEVGLDA